MILSINEFIGHFHPVLVHLPIGILLLAVLFHFLSQKEKYKSLKQAVGISLLLGMVCAIFSCITGFLLSQTGDYNEELICKHQWFGIATTIISILAYFLYKKQKQFLKWIIFLLGMLIIITGHLGGSLTHGSNYLTFSTNDTNSNAKIKPIANVQDAMVYADVIKPILQTKCYSCHSAEKQKGKLRLDEQSFILKGGKDGPVIIAGKSDESEMIKRILLTIENENHMPPKEKPQLSQHDIDLLHWWVGSGANFDKKIKDLPQNENIKPALLALQTGAVTEAVKIPDIPQKPIDKGDETAIKKLKSLGVVIIPVAQNSNYLTANFLNANFSDRDLQLLEPLSKQLIWLNMGNTQITDSSLIHISKLNNLTKLYLQNSGITDKGIVSLKTLLLLQYLNITNTKISLTGLQQLNGLINLQQLFLYKSNVNNKNYSDLRKIFPNAKIDSGGYSITTLITDTTLVKPQPQKK